MSDTLKVHIFLFLAHACTHSTTELYTKGRQHTSMTTCYTDRKKCYIAFRSVRFDERIEKGLVVEVPKC